MTDFGDMANRISKFRDNLKDGLSDATKTAVRRMHYEVKRYLRRNDSVARGHLLRDITATSNPSVGDALIVASVEAPGWSKYVEHGTGPSGEGQYPAPNPGPPTEAIETWVLQKNIIPRKYDSQYALIGAIQEDIAEQGQIPHPFMRPVWHNDSTGYETVIDANHRELKKQLRRL